jgi:hypothetical protein
MRFRGQEWNGSGVQVALVDSGVERTDARLAASSLDGWRVSVNATGHAQLGSDFQDLHGHGTEVAAVVLRDAPGVQLTAIQVTDKQLKTSPEAIAAGIETAFRHGAQVINVSLAAVDQGRQQLLRDACTLAREHGAWVVATGHPLAQSAFPADCPEALSVIAHPDCPQGRIYYFEKEACAAGPFSPYVGRFLTHGYSHSDAPEYHGSGLATAALSARLACLIQALPDSPASTILEALVRQSLCPDPALGFE